MKRILQLDNQLANQIAAGEVVERPASVVKELIENSIDAGATRIEIDIERGGARLIRIVDDGSGIHPDDLPLALSRHATSKIQSFSELCRVVTLGFRGEALASIASVSRLLLRSRMQGSEEGWQAVAEGREMAVKVTPAAAAPGTCVEVRDLFFNTPARRKFLRTEKTEFAHIEETVKREALATPGVAFVLKHNGKIVKRYSAAANIAEMQQKVAAACGQNFLKQSVFFEGQLEQLRISGWLGAPDFHRSESDCQVLMVNGRPVKDRLLGHAIRQSYAELIPQGRFAAYVIFIELDAEDVDVNVHPTKHEVRFQNPRQIHDFLVKLVADCLQQQAQLEVVQQPVVNHHVQEPAATDLFATSKPEVPASMTNNVATPVTKDASIPAQPEPFVPQKITSEAGAGSSYSGPRNKQSVKEIEQTIDAYFSLGKSSESYYRPTPQERHHQATQTTNLSTQIPTTTGLWKDRIAILTLESEIWMLDVWQAWLHWLALRWQEADSVVAKPLLVPQVLALTHTEQWESGELFDGLAKLGFDLTPAGPDSVMVRKLPDIHEAIPTSFWMSLLSVLLQQSKLNNSVAALVQQLIQLLKDEFNDTQPWLAQWYATVDETTRETWRSFAWPVNFNLILEQINRYHE
ncbi:DNA mismatch repair endonuclease MutL [Pleionea sp. CnH1-48]|uniref:DNA mismatch repair endonuclease MutL n=1 Tax=Pleionea sp. CnH1-48 TaxID=2954494 RepID=UPI002097E9B7|nr:DNA mismatch repair endonuclease MutL [Pleionea sp. CnH1-48]MCO7224866.1 DNA mismatch repair endonuclease MutL [Pleionea sp. CnH1-48]